MNMDILKGIGKITLGSAAIGAGTIVGISGVNDIRSAIKTEKLVADSASAAESAEDMDFEPDGDLEDDLPDEETTASDEKPQDEAPEA